MARKTRLPKQHPDGGVTTNCHSSNGHADGTNNAAEGEDIRYKATANPHNVANTELHVQRYRSEEVLSALKEKIPLEEVLSQTRTRLEHVQNTIEWSAGHRQVLTEMDVSKFVIAPNAQRLIYSVQRTLVDNIYNAWGKTERSWDGYTLMFRNGFQSKDERKPVTEQFQMYCETVYCPIFWTLLFGAEGWRRVRKHWAQFKACTIKVAESGMCYGENIFHMHIDGKVGLLEPRNYLQRHMCRLLFSIVTDVVTDKVTFEEAAEDPYHYGATNYTTWQPRKGFRNNHEFHKYMQSLYVERGLENTGLPRPHYEIPEKLIYRAKSGEVLINRSHSDPEYGSQPIHSEPNPCPDRHFFSFDWNNIISQEKGVPQEEMPEKDIIMCMRALEDVTADAFADRLEEVKRVCEDVMEQDGLDAYAGAHDAIQAVIEGINCGGAYSFANSTENQPHASPQGQ